MEGPDQTGGFLHGRRERFYLLLDHGIEPLPIAEYESWAKKFQQGENDNFHRNTELRSPLIKWKWIRPPSIVLWTHQTNLVKSHLKRLRTQSYPTFQFYCSHNIHKFPYQEEASVIARLLQNAVHVLLASQHQRVGSDWALTV